MNLSFTDNFNKKQLNFLIDTEFEWIQTTCSTFNTTFTKLILLSINIPILIMEIDLLAISKISYPCNTFFNIYILYINFFSFFFLSS